MDGRESSWHQAGRTVGSFEPCVRHRLGLSREEFSTSCGAGPQSPCNSVAGGRPCIGWALAGTPWVLRIGLIGAAAASSDVCPGGPSLPGRG